MVVPQGQRGRGYLLHLTSVDNLESIWRAGVIYANSTTPPTVAVDELGSRKIKDDRAARPVPCGAGGVVADYVPFYYSARSPMLYLAHRHHPSSPFRRGQTPLVHVVSHIDVVIALGLDYVLTDRNAVLQYAEFSDDIADIGDLIDWTVQQQKYWQATDSQPDRKEVRMAEFLVHKQLPVDAILGLVVINETVESQARTALASYADVAIRVKRDWYY